MKIQTIDRREPHPTASPPCASPMERFHATMRVLTGKWKGEILWQLVHGRLRFGELRRSLPGITQHMLTTQLRDLERNGLVLRTCYAEVPPRVEYELSPAAMALRPVFEEIVRWSESHATILRLSAPTAPDQEGGHETTVRIAGLPAT